MCGLLVSDGTVFINPARYKLPQNKTNEFSSAFNVPDLVPSVHLQFANLLEKQTSKNIYIFINPGKYYLPLWKNERTLLKLT